MIGGADAEQVKAIGEHRPGGLGKGQPGAVNGQGFLLAAREGRTRVMEAEEGVGGRLEVAGDAIGGTVAGGGLDRPRKVAEKGEQTHLGGMVVSPVVSPGLGPYAEAGGYDLGPYAEPTRAPAERPGPGMGVPHPEERVGLPLGKQTPGIEIGEIMAGGPQQRPAGGIGPEGGEEVTAGDSGGPHGGRSPVDHLSPAGVDHLSLAGVDHLSPAGKVDNLSPAGEHKPPHHMRDKRPTNLIGAPHGNPYPREPLPPPVLRALGEDGPYELGVGGGLEGDVEEPGSGDVDAGNPGRTDQPPPQNLRDPQRGTVAASLLPLPLGKPQRHIGRVIPTPRPRRRPHDNPLRHVDTQLVVLNGTTHGMQHSAGKLGGSHGTSVWERRGDSANRFRPSDGTTRERGGRARAGGTRPRALEALTPHGHHTGSPLTGTTPEA